MKRFIGILLAFSVLLALVGCNQAPQQNDPTQPTYDPAIVALVEQPLTWEQINAIPVADDSMTEEQLRQIIVDFMRLQITFPWTINKNLMYMSNNDPVSISKGYAYGGMPYKGSTVSNLYNVMLYYDEATGVIDVEKYGKDVALYIGNQCSGSSYWAWSRVSNSIKWGGTSEMLRENGCIPVGEYTYSHMISSWHNFADPSQGIHTADICKENGEQVMYESYALLKMADGISIYRVSAGHVRMIAQDAVVVRGEDGKIDPDQSYITYLDQGSSWTTGKQPGGTKIKTQGGVDKKMTFAQMYNDGYLPWRIPEFAGLDPVEKAAASISLSGDTTVSRLLSAKLSANYPISDITFTVKDQSGNVVKTVTVPTLDLNIREHVLAAAVRNAQLEGFADGKHTIEISIRISTGEKLPVYTGTLNAG